MKKILVSVILFYREYISPLKKPSCRFYPTCSKYCLDAISKYGAFRGGYLSVKRLLRCNPFCDGGYDPLL